MNTPYFIEILNSHGDVQAREKILSLPIRIGRSYYNDIILDDQYTAAEHAIIEMNDGGDVIIRDLASKNGIYANEHRAQHFVVDANTVYQLGQTQLRIRTENFSITAELIFSTNHHRNGWSRALIAFIIISVLALSTTWIGDIEESKSNTYISDLCVWLGMAALWAGIFALANRVFGGAAHFTRHLFILSIGLITFEFCSYIIVFLAYAFSWEFISRYGSHLQFALITFMIYFHLKQISPRRYQRLQLICTALLLISSGLVLMKNYQSSSQYADELYMHEILPPSVRLSRNHNLEEFNESINALKIQILEERKKVLSSK